MFVPQGTVVWSDQNFNHEVKSNDNKSKQNLSTTKQDNSLKYNLGMLVKSSNIA